VFLGSVFSSVWIVVANSWQQTPAGFRLAVTEAGTRAEITDFWAMVFNPSSMHRLGHVLLGAFILGGFFVMSISAWYVLRNRHLDFARRSFAVGLVVATLASWGEAMSGHAQAQMVAVHQPAKLAAFEGHFETGEGGTGLYVVGLPDEETQTVRFGLQIPKLLSFLVYEDFDRPVAGLDTIPPEDRPPVVVPFLSYHLMVGLGVTFIGLTSLAAFLLWRRKLFEQRWLLWVFVVAVVGPYLANEAGWVASETGRQPWVVYGLLRTRDAASPSVRGEEVLASLVMFSLAYLALFALWIFVINEKVRHGPPPVPEEHPAARSMVRAAAEVGLGRGGESLTATDEER
jgi:cytochrome d ubiquinol oxidase subunit I